MTRRIDRTPPSRRARPERRPAQPVTPAPATPAPRRRPLAPPPPPRRGLEPGQLIFVVAIGLSAFLLFTLELLAGRLVLPVFGGTPGVWATTLSFFTAVLFAGYVYAHALAGRLDPRRGGLVHLGLAAVVAVATILGPRDVASLRRPEIPEALNVLLAQALIAGPAAFLLAATTPLLSAWYGRRGWDPWWLYATSNGASFAGLLAYPFIIEPFIGLSLQRNVLTLGIVAFAAALAAIVMGRRSAAAAVVAERPAVAPSVEQPEGAPDEASLTPSQAPPRRLGARRILTWLAAAFIPAGLLSATTNFITTDLLAAPLLWVGPLALYLLTFVVVFSDRGRQVLRAIEIIVPAAVTMLWLPWISPVDWPAIPLLIVELGAFFVVATALHGRLAMDRPDSRQLTTFYVVMSAGGALATAFVALVSPVIFPRIYEYPLLVVAAMVMLGVMRGPEGVWSARSTWALIRESSRRLVPFAVAAVVILVLAAANDARNIAHFVQYFGIAALAVAVAVRPAALAAVSLAVLVIASAADRQGLLLERRTFFGVLRITALDNNVAHAEYSGTTLHGLQFLDDTRGRLPTTYYAEEGPPGQVIKEARVTKPNLSFGIVGLGVGTMASYARPGDTLTFFEINQATVDVARDPTYFTYLKNAQAEPRVVLGDARLSLAAEPAASFDILMLDAFSSDAVPTHLLTREALADYARTLRPGGFMLLHATNRYYKLESAMVATARAAGLGALVRVYNPNTQSALSQAAVYSIWTVVAKPLDQSRFRGLGWGDPEPGPILTDDFADLLRVLRFGFG
jgi:SAM-dependent methyltransferase